MTMGLLMLQRELVAIPKRRRFYLKRLGVPLFAALNILWGVLFGSLSGSSTTGLYMFNSLASVSMFVIVPVALFMSASMILREREDRTLGLLLLTHMSTSGCVLGKLLASVFSAAIIIFSVLPMYLLTVSMGGISSGQIALAFLVMIAAILFCSSLGLLIGAYARTEKAMMGILVAVAIGYFLVLPLLLWLVTYLIPEFPYALLLDLLSPFVAVLSPIYGGAPWHAFAYSGICLLLSLPMLRIAVFALSRSLLKPEGVALMTRCRLRLKNTRSLGWLFAPGPLEEDPLYWKDFHFQTGGMAASWFWFLGGILCVWGFSFLVVHFFMGESVDAALAGGITCGLAVLCLVVIGVGSVVSIVMAFGREKRERALEVLLTTPLTDREIVFGKLKGALMPFAPWLAGGILFSLALLADLFGMRIAASSVLGFALEAAGLWFAYSALALLLAVRMRKTWMVFLILGLAFLFLNSCGRYITMIPLLLPTMLLGNYLGPLAYILPDLALHGLAGYLLFHYVLVNFRTLVMRGVA